MYQEILEITVKLPPHLKGEKLSIKLMGQGYVPEVTIVEPPHGKRERSILDYGRVIIDDSKRKRFTLKNVGVIPAQVIVEIHENPNSVFILHICDSTKELANGSNYQIDS